MRPCTPQQVEQFLSDVGVRFDFPAQYLGDEPNARVLDWDAAALRWCLVAPWPYHQSVGNQTIPTVYAAINDGDPGHLCDRAYMPATPRDMHMFARHNMPMFGIQTKRQFRDFDILGFTLAYPVLAVNVVKMLQQSGITLRWRERDPSGPMILAGGQACGSPEILAPVVDCWWLGEAEDEPGNPGVSAVGHHIASFIDDGSWTTDRIGCYAELARAYPFLYFPRFVDTHYRYEDHTARGVGPHLSKRVIGYSSNLEGLRLPMTRRIVHDLDAVPPLTEPVLLYGSPAMGAGDFEIARGCPAWCSFCALTFRAKPYRQRSVEKLIPTADQIWKNMGPAYLAPFSPDFPMYTRRKELLAGLFSQVCDTVKTLSVRIDDFTSDPQFLLLSVQGGIESITLGVEGSSQRMRDFVGKGISDQDLKDAVIHGIRAGIRRFKFFMIFGLPGEDEGDVLRVLRLAKELADIRESMGQPTVRFQFSWTPLMIEANTPFQWFSTQDPSRIFADVFDQFRELKVNFKIGAKAQPDRAQFFQLSQRASRDVGEALVDLMAQLPQGCWGGLPRTVRTDLNVVLDQRGFHNGLDECFDERDRHDMFGWEYVDHGVDQKLLWAVHQQMREFAEHTDSHTYDLQLDPGYRGNEWIERCDVRCQGTRCGACDPRDLGIRQRMLTEAAEDRLLDHRSLPRVDQSSRAARIHIELTIPERYATVDRNHFRFLVRRSAYRSLHLLPADCQIVPLTVRFASDALRTRNAILGRDYVEMVFTRMIEDSSIEEFMDSLRAQTQPWLTAGAWRRFPTAGGTLRSQAAQMLYELEIDKSVADIRNRLDWWAASDYVPLRMPQQASYFAPQLTEVDGRSVVHHLWAVRQGRRLLLRMIVKNTVDPHWTFACLCGAAGVGTAVQRPAHRIEAFTVLGRAQQDFLRLNCGRCGLVIPVNVMGVPYDRQFCPRCKDIADGVDITEPGGLP